MKAATQLRRSKPYIVILALALSACAPLAQVREVKPKLPGAHGTIAEQAIARGQDLQRNDPNATTALGKGNGVAIRDYNFALSRVFSATRDAHLDPLTRPLHVPAPNGGESLLTHCDL